MVEPEAPVLTGVQPPGFNVVDSSPPVELDGNQSENESIRSAKSRRTRNHAYSVVRTGSSRVNSVTRPRARRTAFARSLSIDDQNSSTSPGSVNWTVTR